MGTTQLAQIPDGTTKTILHAEARAGCQGGNDGASGKLWGHGQWNPDWMPLIGATGQNFTNYGPFNATSNALLPPQMIAGQPVTGGSIRCHPVSAESKSRPSGGGNGAGFVSGTKPVPIEASYASPATTPLKADVKRGANAFNFEVK